EGAIATRNGCFCAHPYLHKLLKVKDLSKLKTTAAEGNKHSLPGAVRASFGIYNTEEEVEEFLKMIRLIRDKKWIGEYRFVPSGACNYSLPQKMFDH
ncbi:MAG: aminotransferase class V-fold PLP-dependent enzyme, partial [Candidatus Eremiobacteraeota bacterium]|nr:aminotransferase class V-fold PLP-dependent enzyme [Candidatus Eremiobacteraeota bacterium]